MQVKNVAVFIDAENIPGKYADEIMACAQKYGRVVIKQLYADWSKEHVYNWKIPALAHSITPIQQFQLTTTKNSSDMRLVVDALSVLYEQQIDVFVIVSNDSDYFSLVQKLKSKDKIIVGIGEQKTLEPYTKAFSEFMFLSTQINSASNKACVISPEASVANKANLKTAESLKISQKKLNSLKSIINSLIAADKVANYSKIASSMQGKYPGFKAKSEGFSTFAKLIEYFVSLYPQYQISYQNQAYYLIIKPAKLRP